jgi:hypothetical protein
MPRHVLPKDLPSAIKRLQDRELDLLLAAVLAEQERRGRKPAVSAETSPKRGLKAVAVSLTHAKINAVRAAFKCRRDAVTDRAALWDFPVGCPQSVGE